MIFLISGFNSHILYSVINSLHIIYHFKHKYKQIHLEDEDFNECKYMYCKLAMLFQQVYFIIH